MELKLLFTLLWALVHTRDLANYSFSNEFCNSCINSKDGSYWCTFEEYSTGGYCCKSGESKSECILSHYDSYECSNEKRPQRAEYLLCPRETSQCQNTDDFYITMDEQSGRFETGKISQGRTCKYLVTLYDPAIFSSNNSNTYDVTVDVEYVQDDTYLGVYKHAIMSDNSELVKEVGAGFTGAIKTSVDIHTEIYVQMYPNSKTGSAKFDIRTKKALDSNGEIKDIIGAILIICGLLGLASIGIYAIFKQYRRYKNMPMVDSPCQSEPGVQHQTVRNNGNMHYMNNGPEAAEISSLQNASEDETPARIQNHIYQDQEEAASSDVRNNGRDMSNAELLQQNSVEGVYY